MNPSIGHVQGGWEFIWTAYCLSWLGLALFALGLVPQGPRRLAIRELIIGFMALLAGVMLVLFRASTGEPFMNRTALTVLTLGAGVGLLGHSAVQLMSTRTTGSMKGAP